MGAIASACRSPHPTPHRIHHEKSSEPVARHPQPTDGCDGASSTRALFPCSGLVEGDRVRGHAGLHGTPRRTPRLACATTDHSPTSRRWLGPYCQLERTDLRVPARRDDAADQRIHARLLERLSRRQPAARVTEFHQEPRNLRRTATACGAASRTVAGGSPPALVFS